MDTLSSSGLTVKGKAHVEGDAPHRHGTFLTDELKCGTTLLGQACVLNGTISVKVTKETTNAQYSSRIEWTEA